MAAFDARKRNELEIAKFLSDLDGNPAIRIILTTATANIPAVFEDTSFVSGDSPATLDANAALGRNATEFFIINDGPGKFTAAISADGVAFSGEHTMKNGETLSIDGISFDTIRLTHVADSAYRVVVL